jgi:hypothetical protein
VLALVVPFAVFTWLVTPPPTRTRLPPPLEV